MESQPFCVDSQFLGAASSYEYVLQPVTSYYFLKGMEDFSLRSGGWKGFEGGKR